MKQKIKELVLDLGAPSQALDGQYVNQKKCRTNTYGTNARGFDIVNCNKCRVVCPMRYGKEY